MSSAPPQASKPAVKRQPAHAKSPLTALTLIVLLFSIAVASQKGYINLEYKQWDITNARSRVDAIDLYSATIADLQEILRSRAYTSEDLVKVCHISQSGFCPRLRSVTGVHR